MVCLTYIRQSYHAFLPPFYFLSGENMDLDEALTERIKQIKEFLKVLALVVFIICTVLAVLHS